MKPFVNAKTIWINDFDTPNMYVDAKDKFVYSGGGALLRIAADSHYAVYVNGEYIYASQFPDDEKLRIYDEIDITAFVKAGENALNITAYCTLTDSSVYRRGKPYVIYEVFGGETSIAASGKDTKIRKNPNYKSGEADLITGQMGYTFSFDASKEETAFACSFETGDEYAFSKRPVKMCVMGERAPARLISQGVFVSPQKADTLGKKMQFAYLSYRERSDMGDRAETAPVFPEKGGICFRNEDGDGMYFIFDLGRNEVGLPDIEFTVPSKTKVMIGWGEHLDDQRVRAYVGTRNFASEFIAKPGKNRFFHPLRRIGARYIEIHAETSEIEIQYVGVKPVAYPLESDAQMLLSDQLHQKIYDVCKRTLIMCMHEHYEDCPWREQALYAMDSRNQMLAGYYVFGEYEFARASLRLLARSLREDGLLELCAPARVPVDIPSFSMMYIVALWEYLLYSGDEAFVKEVLPVAETLVSKALEHVEDNGLVRKYTGEGMWNFYEWTENLDGHHKDGTEGTGDRYDAPLSAFIILMITRMSLIYKHFGDNDRAQPLINTAERMRKAAHEAFFDKETGEYFSYAFGGKRWAKDELTQALSVYSAICPREEEKRALSRLISGKMTPVTLAYTVFKYEALLNHGEEFSDWVKKDIERQWGSMLMRGGTSFFETILGGDDFDRAGSLCHGWSAVPAYLYFAYAAGEKPASVGWKTSEKKENRVFAEVIKAVVRKADGRIALI